MNIIERINTEMTRQRFSKGQKKIASFIMSDYDTVAFMTAAELGKKVDVSESTVVRFATMLGYSGYPEMSADISKLIKSRLDSFDRIEIASSDMPQSKVLTTVMNADAEKIKLTVEMNSPESFNIATELLDNAKTIYVVGIRACSPLATYFSFYLGMIYDDVRLITTNSASELFEQMMNIGPKDVIVGISFPRYSVRTIKCLEFANARNAQVIAITDTKTSPVCLYSSCNLFARSDMASIVDSLVAPMSVINSIIVALCLKNKKTVTKRLENLEKVWNDYQVYQSDEINFLDEDMMSRLEGFGQ